MNEYCRVVCVHGTDADKRGAISKLEQGRISAVQVQHELIEIVHDWQRVGL